MWRRAVRLLTPKWVLVHLLFLAAAAGMAWLGVWQLHVARAHGYPLQNTSYVVQWWLFAACALGMWVKVMFDSLRRVQPEARSTGGEVVLRSGRADLARPGAALLVGRDQAGEPVAYRGYHLPDSSRTVAPSHGDGVHNAYNDYLWQLAVADGDIPSLGTVADADTGRSGRELDAPDAADG